MHRMEKSAQRLPRALLQPAAFRAADYAGRPAALLPAKHRSRPSGATAPLPRMTAGERAGQTRRQDLCPVYYSRMCTCGMWQACRRLGPVKGRHSAQRWKQSNHHIRRSRAIRSEARQQHVGLTLRGSDVTTLRRLPLSQPLYIPQTCLVLFRLSGSSSPRRPPPPAPFGTRTPAHTSYLDTLPACQLLDRRPDSILSSKSHIYRCLSPDLACQHISAPATFTSPPAATHAATHQPVGMH